MTLDTIVTMLIAIFGVFLGINIIDRKAGARYNKKIGELKTQEHNLNKDIKQGLEKARKSLKDYQDAKKKFLNRGDSARNSSNSNNK